MKITLKTISDFMSENKMEASEVNVNSRYWGYTYENSPELLEEARKLAKDVDDVCIAFVEDEVAGTAALGCYCMKGLSNRFYLFNAKAIEPYKRESAKYRAITFNTGRGALTNYWYDQYVAFEPGSVV